MNFRVAKSRSRKGYTLTVLMLLRSIMYQVPQDKPIPYFGDRCIIFSFQTIIYGIRANKKSLTILFFVNYALIMGNKLPQTSFTPLNPTFRVLLSPKSASYDLLEPRYSIFTK